MSSANKCRLQIWLNVSVSTSSWISMIGSWIWNLFTTSFINVATPCENVSKKKKKKKKKFSGKNKKIFQYVICWKFYPALMSVFHTLLPGLIWLVVEFETCLQCNILIGSCHAKTCLRAYADSEGPDPRIRAVRSGPSLSEKKIMRYDRMFQWRANTRMVLNDFAHVQGGVNLHTLRMLEDTFSLVMVLIETFKLVQL